MKDIPIVSAATGFMSANGRNCILVFLEALYMPDMRHTLINPNQCRHFGAKVQDNPYHEDFTMSIESPHGEFSACLQSIGTVMFLDTWFATQGNLESYPHIVVGDLYLRVFPRRSILLPSINSAPLPPLAQNIFFCGNSIFCRF